jgi:hypothetical protein
MVAKSSWSGSQEHATHLDPERIYLTLTCDHCSVEASGAARAYAYELAAC